MKFLTTLTEGMTPKQKGGLFALLGGILLGGLGLASMSDADVHIGSDGLNFNTRDKIGGSTGISLPNNEGHIE